VLGNTGADVLHHSPAAPRVLNLVPCPSRKSDNRPWDPSLATKRLSLGIALNSLHIQEATSLVAWHEYHSEQAQHHKLRASSRALSTSKRLPPGCVTFPLFSLTYPDPGHILLQNPSFLCCTSTSVSDPSPRTFHSRRTARNVEGKPTVCECQRVSWLGVRLRRG
jgi:hypothetical protein